MTCVMEEKVDAADVQRSKIVGEILSTERAYLESLTKITDVCVCDV